MPSTATLDMPVIDLGSEIAATKNRLQQLEQMQTEFGQFQERVRLILQPSLDSSKALKGLRKMQKRGRVRFDRRLSDVVHEIMIKRGPEAKMTIKEVIAAAAEAGYKSTSEQPETIFRQMLQRDKRFKKHHVRGERIVRFGLSHH